MLATVGSPTTKQYAHVAPPHAAISLTAPGIILRHFQPHELVFSQGQPQSHVYEVQAGVVCTYRLLSDGRRQVSGFYFPGDLIGTGVPGTYFHSAETISQARLRQIPIAAVGELIRTRPDIGLKLLELASVELEGLSDHLMSLGRRNAMERIASFLMGLSKRNGRHGEDPAKLTLPMTRSDIADFLGLTIETVSRTFTQLRRQQIIALPHPQSVRLLDIGRLADLADAQPETP
mgnify:CR=1 FL=1